MSRSPVVTQLVTQLVRGAGPLAHSSSQAYVRLYGSSYRGMAASRSPGRRPPAAGGRPEPAGWLRSDWACDTDTCYPLRASWLPVVAQTPAQTPGGLTLLMRQLMIKPVIEPRTARTLTEPSQACTLLTSCPATPANTEYEPVFGAHVFGAHGESQYLSDDCLAVVSRDEPAGRRAYSAHRRCAWRVACLDYEQAQPHQLFCLRRCRTTLLQSYPSRPSRCPTPRRWARHAPVFTGLSTFCATLPRCLNVRPW
jgi:hypothetical protein